MDLETLSYGLGLMPYGVALAALNQEQGKTYSIDELLTYNSSDNKEDTEDNDDTIDDFFLDKSKSAQSLIKEINFEIDERTKIKDNNLLKIDYDIIHVREKMHNLEGAIGYLTPSLANRRKSMLEMQIGNLYREKRDQYVNEFKDRIFLKKDLFAALREYWASKHEQDFMGQI